MFCLFFEKYLSKEKRLEEKIKKYNKDSAESLEWSPPLFGASDFDSELTSKVREYQELKNIEVTGKVDASTYRRRVTDRQSNFIKLKSRLDGSRIICDGKFFPIKWKKVVTFLDDDAWKAPDHCYEKFSHLRKNNMIMAHWDVTLSSKETMKILNKRGISAHFLIDSDGTIYQTLDTKHVAWHSGARSSNRASVGVEINNAYYLEHQKAYEIMGYGERPVYKDVYVHGEKLKPFLGFYPIQIEAFKSLVRALHDALKIEYKVPLNKSREYVTTVHSSVQSGDFKGVCCHFHRTTKKQDAAGIDLVSIVDELNNEEKNT